MEPFEMLRLFWEIEKNTEEKVCLVQRRKVRTANSSPSLNLTLRYRIITLSITV